MVCWAWKECPSAAYLNDALKSPSLGAFLEHSIDFCYYIKLLALQMVFFEIVNIAMHSMRGERAPGLLRRHRL